MYEIKLKVNGNGTISTGSLERLRLGTECEINRARLVFDIDSSVEGTYQYVKFLKGTYSVVYRVSNKEVIIGKSVLASRGIWLLSFISTNSGLSNNKLTGSYAFITEPIETVVYAGILNKGTKSEEADSLDKLISMSFETITIPDYVSDVGDYFLYNSNKQYSVKIGVGVKTIGSYSFYKGYIYSFDFSDESELETLSDNSLNNITFTNTLVIPSSVTNWGKYVLKNSTLNTLQFKAKSNLKSLGSYALWENEITKIYLPDRLEILSGNTYVIKNCTRLAYLWIPNTIMAQIPKSAIYGCDVLTNIELQNGFDASCNFSNCTALTKTSMVAMFNALKNLKGSTAKSITLGSTNLAKLTEDEIAIATNKNWTVS